MHFIKDLDSTKPNSFTLLNMPLVIWADGEQQWRVFLDACPHRLVPLSEGRITNAGELECPYHGWRFEGGGGCTAIPEGGDCGDSRTAALTFPCVVKQGMLWVFSTPTTRLKGPVDDSSIPLQPEIEDASWGPPIDVFRDLPYDYATLLENVLDVGHVPFTHHGTVSRRETAGVYDLEVVQRSPGGFQGRWLTGPRNGKWGPQTTEFVAPCFMRHTLDSLDSFANVTSVYATPIGPGRCRAFVRNQLKFGSPLPGLIFKLLPDWLSHVSNHTVLEDDVVFLHAGETMAVAKGMGEKPMGQVYRMPGASDAFVAAFRNWLDTVGGGGPFGRMNGDWLQATGVRLTREQLLDRYHSHTANCRSCSTALRRTRLAKTAAKAAAIVCVVLAPVTATFSATSGTSHPWALAAGVTGQHVAAGLLVVAAVLAFVQLRFAALEQSFMVGSYPPPRNTKP